MEYILQNTDIFDEKIGAKFNNVIEEDSFANENVYELTVSFHVNLLDDSRFEEFNIPPSIKNKGTKKDKIYDVMSFQLNQLKQILIENGIEVYKTTIQGDYLEAENMIKIDISEDTSEPYYTGKGKSKKKMKINVCSIVPSKPYTQETITKLATKRISEIFCDYMNVIKDKKLISEILRIEETDDIQIIFKAFVEQYGDLSFTTNEKEKELRNQLFERSKFVIGKYIDQEKEKV